MHYTLHQLQIFLSVYKHKSITKASEELFLTQPAVSIQLKKLQDQFDIPLTEVIGRQLYITEFGEQIAEVANRILNASEEIKMVTDQYKGLLTGIIKISIVSTGKYVMPYFLKSFIDQNPGVKFEIDVTNKQSVLNTLEENDTDFALISVIPDDLRTEKIELLENRLHLVASPELCKKKRLKIEDLNDVTFIFREKGSATRNAMQEFLDENNIKVKRSIQLVSNEAVKQAMQAGLGYSIIPIIGLKNELATNTLKTIEVKGLPIKTKWNLVYNKGKKLSPACEAFAKHIESTREETISESFEWIS